MHNSILWSKGFIPVYFVAALLHFILFKIYIQPEGDAIYLQTLMLVGLGIASLLYNYNRQEN